MWSWSLIIYHSFLLLIILEKLKGNVFTSILPYKILSIVPPVYSQVLAIWMQNHWYHICPSLPYILFNKARCSQTIFIFIMVFNLEIISIQKTLWLITRVHMRERKRSFLLLPSESITSPNHIFPKGNAMWLLKWFEWECSPLAHISEPTWWPCFRRLQGLDSL